MKRKLLLIGAIALMGCGPHRNYSGHTFLSRKCIAILPFESNNPYIAGTSIGDRFTVQMIKWFREFQVIERKDLMKLLQEQKLSITGITEPGNRSKLGSMLGVDALLLGCAQSLETIQSTGGSISVTIKLVEVQSGRILWADHQVISCATWTPNEIAQIAETLMGKCAKKMVEDMRNAWEETGFVTAGMTEKSAEYSCPH